VPWGRIFALTLVLLAIFVRGLTICVGRDADFAGAFSIFVEKGDLPGELAADDVFLLVVDALPLGDLARRALGTVMLRADLADVVVWVVIFGSDAFVATGFGSGVFLCEEAGGSFDGTLDIRSTLAGGGGRAELRIQAGF
jgi:hypothetical protein